MSRPCGWHAAALTLLVAAAAGCNGGGPTQPEPQYSSHETLEASLDVSRVAVYRGGSPPYSASVASWIGPEGGTLRLLDIEVIVPPLAVTEPTRFRIRLPRDPRKLHLALAEFRPHHVTFLRDRKSVV